MFVFVHTPSTCFLGFRLFDTSAGLAMGPMGHVPGAPGREGPREQNIFCTTTRVDSGLHCPARDMLIVT